MACRVKGMTTQEYRASYNYREEYFKKNPGIFNNIWVCSQCHKLLFGKKNVVIDHIRPLNKGGRNHVSNCTACCRECNAAKSDKVDSRVLKGYAFKAVEQSVSNMNRGVGSVLGLGLGLTAATTSATVRVGSKIGKRTAHVGFRTALLVLGGSLKVATFPIRKGTFSSRLVFLGIYTMFIVDFLANNTSTFNAWL